MTSITSKEQLIAIINDWFLTKNDYLAQLYLQEQILHEENLKKEIKPISKTKETKFKQFLLFFNKDPIYVLNTIIKTDKSKTANELMQIEQNTKQHIHKILLSHTTNYIYIYSTIKICYDLLKYNMITSEGTIIDIEYLENTLKNNIDAQTLLNEISILNHEYEILSMKQMPKKEIDLTQIIDYPKRAKCEKEYGHITKWNVSQVTDFKYCFANKNVFTIFNEPLEWDLSNATDVSFMFEGCCKLNSPLKLITGSKIIRARNMFSGCKNLNQPLELTFNKNADISGIFNYCSSLASPIKIHMDNTENVNTHDTKNIITNDYYIFEKNSNIIDTTSSIFEKLTDGKDKQNTLVINKTIHNIQYVLNNFIKLNSSSDK